MAYNRKPEKTRKRGRLRKKWSEDVEEDIRETRSIKVKMKKSLKARSHIQRVPLKS